jgi:polysaccharide biosynthesis/export protein
MRFHPFAFLLATVIGALSAAVAQTPTSDQLSILKNIPADQQQQLLQGVLGGKNNGTTKTDPSLQTPESVRQKDPRFDQYDKYTKDKTVDGRPLRMADEDPELRPGDTVLIDLITIERRRRPVVQDPTTSASGAGTSALTGQNPNLRNNNDNNSNNLDSLQKDNKQKSNETDPERTYGRSPYEDKQLTNSERETIENFRERILKNNPYTLNRVGVLEIPGLPSIPLAGLTASEATARLSADPDLRDFIVKVTLLRLKSTGEEALKPFGYDLFEGVPSTFAPVSDIQVPIDYIVGPGDTFQSLFPYRGKRRTGQLPQVGAHQCQWNDFPKRPSRYRGASVDSAHW